jgi:hypothetical protein
MCEVRGKVTFIRSVELFSFSASPKEHWVDSRLHRGLEGVVITRGTRMVSQEMPSVDTLQTATRSCHCGASGVLVHQRAYRESEIIKKPHTSVSANR